MLEAMTGIVRQAGEILLHASKEKGVREKSGHADLVTLYDMQVQHFLEDRLLALLPEAGFLGEEDLGENGHLERERLFVVDPIDGTTNFIRGFQHSSISVGLACRGALELGVVYNPYLDELFAAQRGCGAFCNGRPIHVSDVPLAEGIAALGTTPYDHRYADWTFALARQVFERCLDLRRTASACLDLCYVAAGRMDCYFECMLSPWDYAAGSLILQEAGGMVTDLDGNALPLDRKSSLAAGNPNCHRALLQLAAACGSLDCGLPCPKIQ